MEYHQLTEKERYQIEYLISRGKSYSEIGRELGRHRSTIKREINRNSLGLYDGMRDGERVAILLDLLGRKVRVVLDLDAVTTA